LATGDILRTHGKLDELSFSIVSNLAKYLKCSQAALFIVQRENDEVFLELKGCYAYERKKYLTKRVEPGHGLLGQCYLEKRTILLYEVPADYVTITSGLGQATPNCLVLAPLMAEGTVEGVIEVAGFRRLEQHEINFLEKVCESIAAVYKNIKTNDETRRLLEESQEQAEMMQSQEEEMRQNMEELAATQEEMMRKEKEFLKIIAA
jgi:methyl-accepting chemotaxis protein